jgi:hypothetical protein
MSSKQGPHAVGMRTAANDQGGRNLAGAGVTTGTEAEVMSSKQAAQEHGPSARVQRMRRTEPTPLRSFAGAGVASAPHAVGMRTAANDQGGGTDHRSCRGWVTGVGS